MRIVAGRLHCHRNTAFNRIARIDELTGFSVSNPGQLIELGLAVHAVDLLPIR